MRIILTAVLWAGLGWTAFAQPLGAPGLPWYTLETEHFRVIFPHGLAGLAQEAAVEAERARVALEQALGYAPADKIDLVLHDGLDTLHSTADLLASRIIVNVAQAELAEGDDPRAASWLQAAIWREYARLLDTDFVFGFSEALRPLLGRAILPNWKPIFLSEGIAQFLRDKYLAPSLNTRDAMYLRILILSRRPVTLDQLSSIYERRAWPPLSILARVYGALLVRFLEERFGPDVVKKLYQWHANDLRAALTLGLWGDWDSLWRRLTGRSLDALEREFQQWARAQFSEQIEALKAQGLTESQRITKLGHWTAGPQSAPDGKTLVYYHADSARLGGLRLITLTPGPSPVRTGEGWPKAGERDGVRVPDDRPLMANALHPAWSPDGRKLLYIKRDWHQHTYFYGDLYLYDLQARREQRWTERVYRAAFFPDGQRVLLAQYRWGDRGPALTVLDLRTQQISLLREFPLHDYFAHSLAISPDGERIALSLWRRGGFQDIYLLSADGQHLEALTRDRAVDLNPIFSPDGNFVLFSSDRDGVHNLYAYRLADGTFLRVTNVLAGAFEPTISPGAIVFVGYAEDGYDLYKIPFEPESWKPVQIEKEPFPPWDGFPETEYLITPYDPRPSLQPKLWVPLMSETSLGLATWGRDTLNQNRYAFRFDWQKLQPFYWLHYEHQQFMPLFSATLQKDHSSFHQALSVLLPLVTSVSAQQSLSLFYRRAEIDLVSHTIGLGWQGALSGGLDFFRHRLEFLIAAQTRTRAGQRVWQNQLALRLAGTLRLPSSPTHELGFALISDLVSSAVRIDYGFPLVGIERGWGLWPVFLEGVRGRLFLKWAESLKLGVELELATVVGYRWRLKPRAGVVWENARAQFYLKIDPD